MKKEKIGTDMEKQVSKTKTPIIIKIICIFGFAFLPISLLAYIVPSTRELLIQQFGFIIVPIQIVISIMGLAGLIGYWNMQKWGIYIYTTMTVISIIVSIFLKIPFNLGYITAPLITLIGFYYYNKMT